MVLAFRFLVSSDDEIDYSVEAEFYDPNVDDKDELWVQRRREGRISDAVLSCPACFTTLCLDCQRYKSSLSYQRIFKKYLFLFIKCFSGKVIVAGKINLRVA